MATKSCHLTWRHSHAYELAAVTNDKFVLRNPWNLKHPEPMQPAEFGANMEPGIYDPEMRNTVSYVGVQIHVGKARSLTTADSVRLAAATR